MKIFFVMTVLAQGLLFSGSSFAEEPLAVPAEAVAPAAEVVTESVPVPATDVPAIPAAEMPAVTEPTLETVESQAEQPLDAVADNLEFVSGEITAMDETAKTVTIKMYGESGEGQTDKTLTATVDDNTDITDGEQDRDLKSLTAGTEVDVEYDPASKKATYIFVY